MDPQEPRIKPIISSEPGKNRQDSSECLKTSCFPFKTSFEEETKMEEQATEGKYKCSYVISVVYIYIIIISLNFSGN